MKRILIGLLVAGLIGWAPAPADENQCTTWLVPEWDSEHERVEVRSVDGRRVIVLLPPGYDASGRRYPVVYLIHGGLNNPDAWLRLTDIIDFTDRVPNEQRAIVVMPDGSLAPVWANSRDGVVKDDSLFVEQLVPFIDEEYRTKPVRAQRAIGGFSAGAVGALGLAARHPESFSVAATFSGLVNINPELGRSGSAGSTLGYGAGFVAGCSGDPTGAAPFRFMGDPVSEPVSIRELNPADGAINLGGLHLTLAAGNGMPCDDADVRELTGGDGGTSTPPWAQLEPLARAQLFDLSEQLVRAGVAHETMLPTCGIHHYRHADGAIQAWWPRLFQAFGASPPASFDHHRAARSFGVWDWTFTADAARAPEFLDVADASCRALGLTGSGLTTVETASCFAPGRVVQLGGAREANAVADAEGRISFTVDLGPPHRYQQYTPLARALEAAGGYWTSRAVTFRAR